MSCATRLACAAALALALLGAAPAGARERAWTVRPPDGSLTATVGQGRAGAPLRLVVRRSGERLLSGTLGLDTSAGRLHRGLSFVRRRDAVRAVRYTAPAGKRRVHRRTARQMTLTFARERLRVQIEVQISEEGVAYRYRLPGTGPIRVLREHSAFAAPLGTRAWLQRYLANYEAPYVPVPLGRARRGRYALPVLLRLGGGDWALLTESAVAGRYAAASVTVGAARSGRLGLSLAGGPIRAALPLRTPWRVAVVGELATVVESDIAQELGGSSRVADTSWIEPGRVAWSWWSDSSSPRFLERQRQFVDFAARMGWEYALVDAGWDPSWVPALVAYARDRAVRILLWARWSDLRTRRGRDELLSRWKSWGVAGVKLDFIHSDSRRAMAWYERVARAAAARRLLVYFHGSTLPRGIQRRWPNVMTMEAVLGAEHYKTRDARALSPAHNTTLPFTRNVVGSMDYTPVTFSAATRGTTLAHELALSIVFESGLQHFPDSPGSYEAQPAARELLRQVPAAWDETRFLAGYPGRSATLARRRGSDWFVGTISARPAATVGVPLGFLAAGRSYEATIVSDSGGALATERRTVARGGKLALPVSANGGAAVRLAALPSAPGSP